MTGFDTAGELRSRLGDRSGVWEFLRLFSVAWELPAEPVAADLSSPVALREAYACCGLLDPRGTEVKDGAFVFHWTDPLIADTGWGIPVTALDEPDPSVVIDTGSGWQPYLDRLSLACVDLALTAAIEQGDDELCNACELSPEEVPAVMARFDRVPLPDLPMWIDVEESPVRWYSRPGALLRTHGDDWAWLWVRAQTPAGLAEVYAGVPSDRWSQ
ncbi:hypothetical protein OHA21_08960 [Actinoplanes sp. NBC_00393]|uniref:hypothetical protein n=1 Tax=Actinoplanes sp. NBC_00393 TaxID=2975953 RepID=UPI002E1B3BDD